MAIYLKADKNCFDVWILVKLVEKFQKIMVDIE